MARQFERTASSFRAFVEKLEADAERGEADEAPIVEEGIEGVRVMTVHKAKGLEFPVVILADPTCSAARDTPSRHVDPARHLWVEQLCGAAPTELLEAAAEEWRRDQAEAIRVAYVAATRARDLLVVPVCGDQPIEGWLEVLDPMLYPADEKRRSSEPAPGCPPFGEDSVLERGPDAHLPGIGPVRPGLHRPKPDGPPVVWWDPAVLALDVEEQAALRHQRVLEQDGDPANAAKSVQSYVAWKTARETVLTRASQPLMRVQTVTALAGKDAAKPSVSAGGTEGRRERSAARAYPPVHVETVERRRAERPGGRRFGTLVHAILATIDLDAEHEAIRAAADINGTLVAATEEEIQAGIETVAAALEHPILRRAAASG
jgi:ATP-dependent exoDNAse (exonuclease V) beta subunit